MTAMRFARFDVAGFLGNHWQKKPLLIRNPWATWSNPLDPDELAGLACEREVESRLITRSPSAWHMEQGPLPESRFGRLGKEPWTLLVQAVDHHVPAVAALLDPFRFIPNWRMDDVMVSYATDGGGVGPHFDQYDVFLVQGLGRRRWQIGGLCDDAAELLPHEGLRLLADFDPVEEMTLDPGDILYLPPRIAHEGIALGDDCMTYSVGFRAPSRHDLIAGWAEHALADLEDDDRYADPAFLIQHNPGEIADRAIDRLHAMVAEKLLDRGAFAEWFGRYATSSKYPEIDWRPEHSIVPDDLRSALAQGVPLVRNPASRFSFVRRGAARVSLFVDGECFACSDAMASFAERLCQHDSIPVDPAVIASMPALTLIAELFNRGCLAFDPQS